MMIISNVLFFDSQEQQFNVKCNSSIFCALL